MCGARSSNTRKQLSTESQYVPSFLTRLSCPRTGGAAFPNVIIRRLVLHIYQKRSKRRDTLFFAVRGIYLSPRQGSLSGGQVTPNPLATQGVPGQTLLYPSSSLSIIVFYHLLWYHSDAKAKTERVGCTQETLASCRRESGAGVTGHKKYAENHSRAASRTIK